MKKVLISIFVVFGILWLFRAEIASSVLSRQLKINVHIESIALSSNTVTLRDIKIFDGKSKYNVKKIRIVASFRELFNNPTLIHHIDINGLRLHAELPTLNDKTIQKAITKLLPVKKKKNKEKTHKEKTMSPDAKTFIVNKLTLKNTKIKVASANILSGPLIKTSIPKLEFIDLNSGKPLTAKQLLRFIQENI